MNPKICHSDENRNLCRLEKMLKQVQHDKKLGIFDQNSPIYKYYYYIANLKYVN